MKQRMKEIIALAVQLALFYALPLTAGPTDMMGLVLLLLLSSFALAALLGGLSGSRIKHAFPAAAALLFIPSIFVYYNDSAIIHAAWYFAASEAGLLAGSLVRRLIK